MVTILLHFVMNGIKKHNADKKEQLLKETKLVLTFLEMNVCMYIGLLNLILELFCMYGFLVSGAFVTLGRPVYCSVMIEWQEKY